MQWNILEWVVSTWELWLFICTSLVCGCFAFSCGQHVLLTILLASDSVMVMFKVRELFNELYINLSTKINPTFLFHGVTRMEANTDPNINLKWLFIPIRSLSHVYLWWGPVWTGWLGLGRVDIVTKMENSSRHIIHISKVIERNYWHITTGIPKKTHWAVCCFISKNLKKQYILSNE